MDPLGLYLSIPFCRSKCTYCNFASGVFPSSHFEQYISRLEEDMKRLPDISNPGHGFNEEDIKGVPDLRILEPGFKKEWVPHVRTLGRGFAEENIKRVPHVRNFGHGFTADTIYLGGGTPSILPAALVRRLFSALRREFIVHPLAEITVECAPGQLDDETLAAFVECGVNRISFGIQSFIDREAALTGRLHTRAIALEDIRRVRAAGIGNISLDLIAGMPGQTSASWRESLSVLADTGVDHASIYLLEIDDDSRLGREIGIGGLRYHAAEIPSDDTIADMSVEAVDFLAGKGIIQYEISNFARPGAKSDNESRHNLKYWQRRPYLGLGVDAHSMLRTEAGTPVRFATTDDLQSFLRAPGWEQPHHLSRREELEEAWFLGLRLNRGVSLYALRDEFGSSTIADFSATLATLESEGLLRRDGDRVTLTSHGRLLSNEVFSRFLADPVVA
jgi:oxygen-independent coproporphyrinogen-3 oxidase